MEEREGEQGIEGQTNIRLLNTDKFSNCSKRGLSYIPYSTLTSLDFLFSEQFGEK